MVVGVGWIGNWFGCWKNGNANVEFAQKEQENKMEKMEMGCWFEAVREC